MNEGKDIEIKDETLKNLEKKVAKMPEGKQKEELLKEIQEKKNQTVLK